MMTSMYTVNERELLRETLLARGRSDIRFSGGAITGSAADGRQDAWSDIDLAFGVAHEMEAAIADWTEYMYTAHCAAHHMDVSAGDWLYRVFLLGSGLQVDLAFVNSGSFRALSPAFRLEFGTAREALPVQAPNAEPLINWGWLYALHVRSAAGRGHLWQAEFMLSAMRDTVLALACLRHGLPAAHAKGVHQLPAAIIEELDGALVSRLTVSEIARAYRVVCRTFLAEAEIGGALIAERIRGPLLAIADDLERLPCETK